LHGFPEPAQELPDGRWSRQGAFLELSWRHGVSTATMKRKSKGLATGLESMHRKIILEILFACVACGFGAAQTTVDWPVYSGGPDAGHYSKLTQINRANVHRLTTAWSFDTGEKGNIEDNPLIVDGALYAYTPSGKVIALDAATRPQSLLANNFGRFRWASIPNWSNKASGTPAPNYTAARLSLQAASYSSGPQSTTGSSTHSIAGPASSYGKRSFRSPALPRPQPTW